MKKIFIDTGYFLALINKNDPYHQRALKLSDDYDGDDFITTLAVLLEVGNSLSRIDKYLIVEALQNIFNDTNIEIVKLSDDLISKGFELFKSHKDKEWSLVDCISFVVMRERNLDFALAFDKHFLQAGFQIPTPEN